MPDKFAHIPFVTDITELELWLATNHELTFSLRDTNRFQRTSSSVQGKQVYQEIETGHFWYLDNFHKLEHEDIEMPRHYEVFDSLHQHIGVADLQGNLDTSKRRPGRTF